MTYEAGFATLANDYGDYFEVRKEGGQLYSTGDFDLLDCPRSVVNLVRFWFGMEALRV